MFNGADDRLSAIKFKRIDEISSIYDAYNVL